MVCTHLDHRPMSGCTYIALTMNLYQITKYGDFSYVNDSGVEIKKNIGHLESFKSFVDVMKKTLDFGKFNKRQYYDEEMYIYYNLKVRKETKLWYKEFI